MNELIILFIILGWVSTMLKSGARTGGRNIPMPPEHLRPKKKESVLKMENPPKPPIKKGNCYLDCGNTHPSPGPDIICLKCGSSIIK